MSKLYRNSGEVLAERAMEPDVTIASPKQAKPRGQLITEPGPARRMIYGGTMPPPPPLNRQEENSAPPKNRKVTTRRVPPSRIIILLMVAAVAIVLYIGNIIAVNQLVNDIHREEQKLEKILNDQEMLKARINQTSSLERIRKRAEEELGLQNPKDAPEWLEVDREKIQAVEEKALKR